MKRVAGVMAFALATSLVGLGGIAASASAAAPATLTLSGPSIATDDTHATVTAMLVDGSSQPIVGETVMFTNDNQFTPEWACVTLADGTCTVSVLMTVSRTIAANTNPAGAYPGIASSNVVVIAREVPTAISIVRVLDGPVEIDQVNYGLNAVLVEANSGMPIGGETVTLTRTDVVPNVVMSGVTDYKGEYYIAPIAAPNATWVASFAGNGSAHRLSSTSSPYVLANAIRTPIITSPNGTSSPTINQGEAVVVTGKVVRFDQAVVPGLTMELWGRNKLGGAWRKVGTTISDSSGLFEVSDVPRQSTWYQWRHPAGEDYVAADSGTSGNRVVTVRVVPTILVEQAPASTVSAETTVTVVVHLQDAYGTPLAGQTVAMSPDGGFIDNPPEAVTNANGDAALTFLPDQGVHAAGAATYRVRFAGLTAEGATGPAADSPPFSVLVTHDSALTASTSKTLVAPGGQATISGSLSFAGASPGWSRSVELWQSVLGEDWVKRSTHQVQAVGTPTGTASVVVNPTAETAYQWRYAGDAQTSAALSAPVLVAITSAPQATNLTAGATLTTVAPGRRSLISARFSRADGLVDTSVHTFELWQKVGTGGWVKAATTVMTGTAPQRYVTPTQNTAYQWRFVSSATLAAASSNVVTVHVKPRIGIALSKSKVHRGARFVVSGRLDPRLSGVTVDVMKGGKRIATVKTGAHGQYKARVRFSKAGTVKLRVVTRGDRRLLSASSVVRKVTIT